MWIYGFHVCSIIGHNLSLEGIFQDFHFSECVKCYSKSFTRIKAGGYLLVGFHFTIFHVADQSILERFLKKIFEFGVHGWTINDHTEKLGNVAICARTIRESLTFYFMAI